MNPRVLSITLAAADDDGVAQNQTPAGAGNLTLNGALVAGGVAVLTTGNNARQVLVTTASDESGKTLTITGTDENGTAISETMTGPNATTGVTTRFYKTVTQVAVSAAFTGNVKVGTNAVGATTTHIPDWYANPFSISLGLVISGTIDVDVQHTFDDTMDTDYVPSAGTWFDHDDLAAETASGDGNYAFPVRGIRLLQNSGTGTATLTIIQAG